MHQLSRSFVLSSACLPFGSALRKCLLPIAAITAMTAGLAGCGMIGGSSIAGGTTPPAGSVHLNGSVRGGQQPVVGSTITLYAAGKTGVASAPRSMLTSAVISDGNGDFSITGLYTCNAGDQVYITASGGNSGSGSNSAIAMMTALGPCSTLLANAATTLTTINEVTTVASINALHSYMTGVQALGADYTNTASSDGLAAAFANVLTLVDPVAGVVPATSTGNGLVPQTTINSLANSIAACVNSAPSTSTPCNNLFSATTVSGSPPADTLQAVLNVVKAPTSNTSAIFQLASGTGTPFQPTLNSAPASYQIAVAHPSDVLMYHNDISRDGVQSYEQTLTPANVASVTFGKKRTFPVDSYLFAQPLYIGGVGMPDGAVHNVVIAATTHGTVYAFDADGNNPGAGYLWSVSLIPSGERYPVTADYGNCSNPPEAGIVGTPVIDRSTQTIYVVVKSITTTSSTFYQRLHAISLLDGTDEANSPQAINPVFAGTGDGSSSGTIVFNAQRELNRSALLLTTNANGTKTVWIDYASHCDIGPYHGDVLGYNAGNISQNTASFNNTPNGNDGGIWMGSGGMAADSQGYVYALGGNGTFDANTGGPDYGDGAIKLLPPPSGAGSNSMTVADYFTPSNQANLQSRDLDLGGAAGILFTDSGSNANLLIASDKNGYVYLLNTANMGQYDTGTHGIDSMNGDVQDFAAGGTFIYNFAFFNNTLYTSTPLKAYAFTPGTSGTPGTFNTTPTAQPGVSQTAPVVSANGTANAIVWAQDTGGELHAFTPALAEIYNSTQAAGSRDTPATFVKFNSPVIANGNVYVGGQGALVVYGLLQ